MAEGGNGRNPGDDGEKYGNSRTIQHHIPGASEPVLSSSVKPQQSIRVSLSGSGPLPDHPIVSQRENHEISEVEDLQRVVDEFQTAHGLALLFSNQTGFKKDTPSIHNSSRAMSLAMGNLSFATIIYQDKKNDQYRCILKAISKVKFGASYKCIFIYCTGHGQKGYLKVIDGMFSIKEMKSILSPEKAPSLKDMVIYTFWDCCRTVVNSREVLMTQTEDNLVIVYSVPIKKQSLLLTEEGFSFATKELIKLILELRKDCNLFDLLTVELTNRVRGIELSLRTDFEGSISHKIYPCNDKLMSMSPRNIAVTENHDENTCLISWEAPHHVDKYSLLGYSIRDEDLTYIESGIQKLEVTLSRSKICTRKVTVCAHYDHLAEIRKGGEEYVNKELIVDGHKDGKCPFISLKSDSLIPSDVQVSFSQQRGGQLKWTKPVALQRKNSEFVSVQRALSNSSEGEDAWKYVTKKSRVKDSSYEIVAPDPSRYEYRMRIHNGRRTSPWIPADKQEPESLSCFKRLFAANPKRILPFLFILTFLILTLILYGAAAILLVLSNPSGNHLIVADGVCIDCDRLNWIQKMIYSHVYIKEVATDIKHDDRVGFNITVWSEKKNNFSVSNLLWTFESNVTEGIFQIKNQTNDTYMWKNSTVYFAADTSAGFNKLQAFLIRGSDNKNFFLDQQTLQWTEQSQDLLVNNIVNWRIQHNDYYYVLALVDLPDTVQFTDFCADVHFTIYECKKGNNSSTIKRLDNVARPIKIAIDFFNRNRTLCRAIADSIHLKVDKTHLHLTYATRKEFVFTIPPVIGLILTILIFNHFSFKYTLCCICKQLVKQCSNRVKRKRGRVRRRRDYHSIQSIQAR